MKLNVVKYYIKKSPVFKGIMLRGGTEMASFFDNEKKTENDFWDLSALLGKEKTSGAYRDPSEQTEQRRIPLVSVKPSISASPKAEYRSSPFKVSTAYPKETAEHTVPSHPFIISVKEIKTGDSSSVTDSFSVYFEKYKDLTGKDCPYIPVYDNSPVYTALSADALAYYFWWRDCQRRGEYIKCDLAYLSLRMAELINGDYHDAESVLLEMWRLYEAYTYDRSELFVSGADSMLAEVICDYSLIHGLTIPDCVSDELILRASRKARFREIFFDSSHPECFLKLLLAHASDHALSVERYSEQMAGLDCETYVCGALAHAIRKARADKIDHPLAMEFREKTTLQRSAFGGGVFVLPKNRRVIRVEFCSANRSYTLRNTVTGIVKHCENCLRAHVGVSARLKIYSLEPFFRDAVDEFFAAALPKRPKLRSSRAKDSEVLPEYEKLYDLPDKKEFSVERAKKIEELSWVLTERLVAQEEDFAELEEKKSTTEKTEKTETYNEHVSESNIGENISEELAGILSACPQYRAFLFALKEGKESVFEAESEALGKPLPVICDEINAASFDVLGDVLIEDLGNGPHIIEDYLYIFDEK